MSNVIGGPATDADSAYYINGVNGHNSNNNDDSVYPNQKKLMKSWLEKRVNEHVKMDAELFDARFDQTNGIDHNNNNNNNNNINNENDNDNIPNGTDFNRSRTTDDITNNNNNNNNNNTDNNNMNSHKKRSEYLVNRTGTMRQLSQVSTTADTVIENAVIQDVYNDFDNRNNEMAFEFDMEEYVSDDENNDGNKVKIKKFRGLLCLLLLKVTKNKNPRALHSIIFVFLIKCTRVIRIFNLFAAVDMFAWYLVW